MTADGEGGWAKKLFLAVPPPPPHIHVAVPATKISRSHVIPQQLQLQTVQRMATCCTLPVNYINYLANRLP